MRILLLLPLATLFLVGCRTNETPQEQVDDMKITAELKSKLAKDVGLSSLTDIAINSTNGVVTLSGQVNTTEQKSRAEAIAKSVPRVVRVIDDLQVAGKNSRLDRRSGRQAAVA